jgi:hypothetical protein
MKPSKTSFESCIRCVPDELNKNQPNTSDADKETLKETAQWKVRVCSEKPDLKGGVLESLSVRTHQNINLVR